MKKKNKKKIEKVNKKIRKERKNLSLRKTVNLHFWVWTLEKPEQAQEFIDRGDDRQRDCIKRVLNYLKKTDEEEFERLGGKECLKKLQEF